MAQINPFKKHMEKEKAFYFTAWIIIMLALIVIAVLTKEIAYIK
jgi:hypothetical protein